MKLVTSLVVPTCWCAKEVSLVVSLESTDRSKLHQTSTASWQGGFRKAGSGGQNAIEELWAKFTLNDHGWKRVKMTYYAVCLWYNTAYVIFFVKYLLKIFDIQLNFSFMHRQIYCVKGNVWVRDYKSENMAECLHSRRWSNRLFGIFLHILLSYHAVCRFSLKWKHPGS